MVDETKSGTDDTTGTPSSDSADKGRLGELLEHIKEFEEGTQKTGRSATSKDADELAALRKEVSELRAIEADRSYRTEMDEYLVPTVQADLNVHPKLVEAWLNEVSGKDSKLMAAWENRGTDRAAYEDAVKALVPKFKAFAEKEGIEGTAGTNKEPDPGLAAAVRNARTTSSASGGVKHEDLGSLSDTDFALRSSEIFRLSRAGQLQ